jgi:hypothetical protein
VKEGNSKEAKGMKGIKRTRENNLRMQLRKKQLPAGFQKAFTLTSDK